MTSHPPCYVISLAREAQKRRDFLERNRLTGLDFEVFEAIDGNTLTGEESVRRGLIVAEAEGYTPGAIGVAASHRDLWSKAIASERSLMVFEDDAYIRRDILRQLRRLLSTVPAWDIIMLGFNTDAVLDIRLSANINLVGSSPNRYPTADDLEIFSRETGPVVPVPLNNAMGAGGYLIAPSGARKLMSIFPLDNRTVAIPGNLSRYGTLAFRCVTFDMMWNTILPVMQAFMVVPPLALPLNNVASSTTKDLGQA